MLHHINLTINRTTLNGLALGAEADNVIGTDNLFPPLVQIDHKCIHCYISFYYPLVDMFASVDDVIRRQHLSRVTPMTCSFMSASPDDSSATDSLHMCFRY